MDPILFYFFSFKLTLENKKFKEIEEIENSGVFFAIEKDISAHNLYYLFDSLVHT